MIKKYTVGQFQTNTYLIIEDNHCVVIDPGLDFEEVSLEITSKYVVDKILITHGHLDHIDGIRYLNAPIYISEPDYDFLFDSQNSLYKFVGMSNPIQAKKLEIFKIKDNDILNIFGKELKVIHTPGHTKGSLCFLYEDKLFSGDTLFYESVGRTDFPTGNIKDLEKSVSKLLTTLGPNVQIYPGHDQKTSVNHEKKHNLLYIDYKKRTS